MGHIEYLQLRDIGICLQGFTVGFFAFMWTMSLYHDRTGSCSYTIFALPFALLSFVTLYEPVVKANFLDFFLELLIM